MKYDYIAAMVEDIHQYMLDNGEDLYPREGETCDNYRERLNDDLWGVDEVTGNGCDFYATEEECYEFLKGNLPTYFEAAYEFNDHPRPGTPWLYKNPAQHMDCTIRCYLLYEAIDRIIDMIWNKEEE